MAFNRDRSVLGLINGYDANPGLSRFFSEVKSVLAENPHLLTLEDVAESARDATRGYGSSALPAEIGVGLVKRWNEEVSYVSSSGKPNRQPLHACFSASLPQLSDIEDFKSLQTYAGQLDHMFSSKEAKTLPAIRREWLASFPIPTEIFSSLVPALERYRGCKLVMQYDRNACGQTDAQRGARMEAHKVAKILTDNLPALRAAKSYVQVPTVEYGSFVRLSRVMKDI
jgi:hypothetical protein